MSIVLKLQKKCLDKNEDLQSLLREALVISTKLKLNDFKEWINKELKGYGSEENVPEYRKIKTSIMFYNHYTGQYMPAVSNKEDKLNNIKQAIGELEKLSKSENNLEINLSPKNIKVLMKRFDTEYVPQVFIDKIEIYGIVEQVRNLLLDWTLKLEEDTILGNDDLIFSQEEKEAAKNIHIENFNGIMGNVDKLGNMSTGDNTTNIYNENNISNEIDNLISEIKKLNIDDQDQIIIDLEDSKKDTEKAKSVLGGLLSRGAEVSSISSAIIGLLGLL